MPDKRPNIIERIHGAVLSLPTPEEMREYPPWMIVLLILGSWAFILGIILVVKG
jgi:hypothetical protein